MSTPAFPSLRRFYWNALDLLFPRHCIACSAWIPHAHLGYLCPTCASNIPRITSPRCLRCAMPLGFYAKVRFGCMYCKGADLRFRQATAPCRHEGVAREAIHAFKYQGADFLAPFLADLMIVDLSETTFLKKVDLIVPVPLHWIKKMKRGYNQAALLAKRVAEHYRLPCDLTTLMRIRETPTQTALTRTQRQENLRGTFAVRWPEKVKGKIILLCDDVMTTGATASECARTLMAAGARAVYVSVVARRCV